MWYEVCLLGLLTLVASIPVLPPRPENVTDILNITDTSDVEGIIDNIKGLEDPNILCQPGKIDLMFVMDTSGSMKDAFEEQKKMAIEIIEDLPITSDSEDSLRVAVALVRFSGTATLALKFDKGITRNGIIEKIKEIKFTGGSTQTASAVTLATKELERGGRIGATKTVVLLTDGKSEDPWPLVVKTSEKLHQLQPEVFVLSISPAMMMIELEKYAGNEHRVYSKESIAQFKSDLTRVLTAFDCKPTKPQLSLPVVRLSETIEQPIIDQCNIAPVDLMIILDTSTSVEEIFLQERQLAIDLIKSVPVSEFGTRISLATIRFHSNPFLEIPFDSEQNKQKLLNQLEAIEHTGGSTSTPNAVRLAVRELNKNRRKNAKAIVVLVSDGNSQDPMSEVRRAASDLRKTKAIVYAVTHSPKYYLPELLIYAGSKDRVYFDDKVSTFFTDLDDITNRIECRSPEEPTEISTEAPQITTQPETTEKAIESTEKPTEATEKPTEAPTTIEVPKSLEDCVKTTDLMIILDTSSSIVGDFEKQRQLAIDIVKSAPTSGRNMGIHVGLVSFADRSQLVIRLTGNHNKEELLEKIKAVKHVGGGTGTAAAVRLALSELSRGRRQEADQIVVLINDGYSRDPWREVQDVSKQLKESTKNVYAVTFNRNPYLPELETYASDKKHLYIGQEVDHFTGEIKSHLVNDIGSCAPEIVVPDNQVVEVTEKPETTKVTEKPKETLQEIGQSRDKKELGVVRFPKPSAKKCDPVDIMIILDTSGSVKEVFEKERQLALDIVGKLPEAGRLTAIKLALVRFAAFPGVEISFADNLNKEELRRKILAIEFTGGSTYTASAVQMAINEINRGSRPGVRTVVLLINDGNSADDWFVVAQRSKQLQTVTKEVYAVTFSFNAYLPELVLYAGSKNRVYQRDSGVSKFFQDLGQFTNPNHCAPQPRPEKKTTILPSIDNTPLVTEPIATQPTRVTRPPIATKPTRVTRLPIATIPPNCKVSEIDFMLVLDTSGSVEDVFLKQKALAIETVQGLPIGSRISVAIIKFSDRASLQLDFQSGQSTNSALATLQAIQYTGGNTATGDAIKLAVEELLKGRRDNAKQVVVLMNDGNSQDAWQTVLQTSKSLHDTGAEVFAVSYSDDVFLKELATYAGSQSRVYLKNQIREFRRDIRKVTSVVVCPTERPPVTPSPGRCSYSKMDLVIILDASGSVKEKFEHYREIALSLIERLPIGVGQTHVGVGLVSFSKSANLQLQLTHGQDKSGVRRVIENVKFNGGSTHTAKAVELALGDLARGRRSDAVQVVVLMNDGNSQDLWPKVISASRELGKAAGERFVVALGDQIYMPELVLYSGNPDRVYTDKDTNEFLSDVVGLLGDGSNCPQPTEPVPCGSEKIDFMMVVDSTGPSAEDFQRNRNIMLDILGGIPFETGQFRFAIINFADDWAKLSLKLNDPQDRDSVLGALTSLKHVGGKTMSEKAVMLALKEWERAKRPDAKPVFLMLMNNEESSDDAQVIVDTGTKLRNTGGTIYGCAFQRAQRRQDLLSYCSNKQSNVFLKPDISRFVKEMRQLTKEGRPCAVTRPPIGTTPENYVSIRQKDVPEPQLPDKPRTTPVPLPTSTFKPGCVLDILYIMDASGSVQDVFNRAKQSAVDTVNHLRLGPNNARVAMIKFAGPGKAYTVFPFNKYKENKDIIFSIKGATHISGTTDVTGALRLGLQEYKKDRGARPGMATPLVFIFTDGYAMNDTTKAAEKLREKIPDVFAIATGKPVNTQELINITGDKRRVFTDANLSDFLKLLGKILESCDVL